MSTKKHISRSRKKVHLLQNRLDFHVPDNRVDPSKSKNISSTKVMEEREPTADPDNEDGDDFVYEDWEERLDDEDDDDNNKTNHSGINTTSSTSQSTTSSSTRQSTTSKRISNAFPDGRVYPPDLWFLIAKHVQPESVRTFSQICRGSCAVVRTFQFWSALYQRTYDQCRKMKSVGSSEQELKVSRVVRPLGVKYHVIRALFNIHPPFKEMLDRQKLNSVDFDFLIGNKCSSFWLISPARLIGPAKSVFVFNLLLKRPESSGPVDKSSLFNDTSKAVMYNPFEDSAILQIVCDQFVPVISPMGFHVTNIKYNTSRDMRNMRLELGLSTTKNLYMSSKRREEETRVFDPISSVRVLPWWHPNFPTVVHSKIPESSRTDESWDS